MKLLVQIVVGAIVFPIVLPVKAARTIWKAFVT